MAIHGRVLIRVDIRNPIEMRILMRHVEMTEDKNKSQILVGCSPNMAPYEAMLIEGENAAQEAFPNWKLTDAVEKRLVIACGVEARAAMEATER